MRTAMKAIARMTRTPRSAPFTRERCSAATVPIHWPYVLASRVSLSIRLARVARVLRSAARRCVDSSMVAVASLVGAALEVVGALVGVPLFPPATGVDGGAAATLGP